MPGPQDEKFDEAVTSPNAGERTTPYGATPTPVGEAPLFTDSALAPLRQRYDLLAELGRGGMGVVYRARDRETRDTVALKILQSAIASDQQALERFRAELLLARKITHKNVCRTHELLRFGELAVISMEFIEGESLRSFLHRYGSVPLRRGVEWVRQICSALAEAHAQGVVHRDLKPENIMIARDGAAKVMDFGIARSMEALTAQTAGIIGTPAYMSPEQAEGKSADTRSDIYSLGLMMYEMFTGQPAFRADTPVAMVAKHVHETPLPPREVEPDLPERINRAIQKCLEKNPKKRFQTVGELEAALTEKPEPVITPVSAAPELVLPIHLARWQRSDTLLSIAALAAIFVFFVAFRSLHPAGSMEVTVTAQEAQRIAQDAAKRLGWDLQAPEARLGSYWGGFFRWGFYVIWEKAGGKEARAFGEYLTKWSPPLPLVPTTDPLMNYVVSARGRLKSIDFWHRWRGEKPVAPSTANEQKRRQLAVEAVRSAFGRDLSAVEPSAKTPWGSEVYPEAVYWRIPTGNKDIQEWIYVFFQNEVPDHVDSSLRVESEGSAVGDWLYESSGLVKTETSWLYLLRSALADVFPAPYREVVHHRLFFFVPFFVVCVIFFFIRRRIWRNWSCRTDVIIATVIASLLTIGSLREIVKGVPTAPAPAIPFLKVLYPIIYFVAAFFVVYAILTTISYFLTRRSPERITTYVELFRKGLRAESAGLAIIRGAATGWVILVFCLLMVGLSHFLHSSVPSLTWMDFALPSEPLESGLTPTFESGLPPAVVISVVIFLEALIATWLLTALPFALLRGVTRNRAVLVGVCALMWCLAPFSLQGATFGPALPFYAFAIVQAAIFAFVLLRFDLLTTFFAVVTVETWLLTWPGYVTFHKVDTLQYFLVLFVWLLALLWGIGLYFRPQLVAGWRRGAAVFE